MARAVGGVLSLRSQVAVGTEAHLAHVALPHMRPGGSGVPVGPMETACTWTTNMPSGTSPRAHLAPLPECHQAAAGHGAW